jgi:hypothetical protein
MKPTAAEMENLSRDVCRRMGPEWHWKDLGPIAWDTVMPLVLEMVATEVQVMIAEAKDEGADDAVVACARVLETLRALAPKS